MKCTKEDCGAENPDGAKFCSKCGSKLEELKTCPKCGKTNLPNFAQFCPECRTKLGEDVKSDCTEDNIKEQKQKCKEYLAVGKNEEAVKILEDLAKQGDAEAFYILANFYYNGDFVGKNKKRGVLYYILSSLGGNLNADEKLSSIKMKLWLWLVIGTPLCFLLGFLGGNMLCLFGLMTSRLENVVILASVITVVYALFRTWKIVSFYILYAKIKKSLKLKNLHRNIFK